MTTPLMQCLELPCGLSLPNRVVKSALSEDLASDDHSVSDDLLSLYQRVAETGAGLVIAGDLQIDPRFLAARRDLAFDESRACLSRLAELARVSKAFGGRAFIQISHPGICSRPAQRAVGPSAMLKREARSLFGEARAARKLTTEEAYSLVRRFTSVAGAMHEAGFDGVVIDATRTGLIGQFLSSDCNRRTDVWGGSAFARHAFLLEIVRGCRKATSNEFAIGVRIEPETLSPDLTDWLSAEAIDLLALRSDQSDTENITPFTDHVRRLKDRTLAPIMVTDGYSTIDEMTRAISSNRADLIGLATSLSDNPDLLMILAANEDEELQYDDKTSVPVADLNRGRWKIPSDKRRKLKAYRKAMKAWAKGGSTA